MRCSVVSREWCNNNNITMSCWVTVSLDGFNPVTAVDPRDPNGMLSRLTFGPNIRQQKYRHLHLRSSPELSVIAETTTQCYAKRITCPAANRGRCDENNNESHGHRYTVTLHTWYPLPRYTWMRYHWYRIQTRLGTTACSM